MDTRFFRFSQVYFAYFAILGVVSHYFGLYLSNLGLNPVMVGSLLSLMTLGRVLGPVVWSSIADKTGQRRLIIQLGSLLACLCFAALWFLDSLIGLTLALGAFSLFWSAILPQLEALTAQNIKGQAKIYSRIRIWGSISFIILVMLTGITFEYFGVKDSIEVMTMSLLILLLISSLRLPKDRNFQTQSNLTVSIKSKLTEKNCVTFLLSAFLLQLSFAAYYGFFSIYLTERGYSGFQIGSMIAFGVFCEVVIFWFAGKILSVVSLKSALIFCFAATAIRWLVLAEFANWFWVLLCSQLLHAFSFGLHHVAAQRFIRQHFNSNQQSRGQAFYSSISFGIGGVLGSFIAGWSWYYSQEFTYLGAAVVALFGAVLLLQFQSPKNVENSINAERA
ncbi:MFS transporter [Catenovulum sp. SM1970]|uniref:MFS transporter n=1 Tax=Marinifaba aquimaris TaxID=2741323 RepID=UPI001574AFFA|nr:MFS transporter [Marinifaba aquimaris]NTS75327.1 MFS transporter [Marinifaba aquimaris]